MTKAVIQLAPGWVWQLSGHMYRRFLNFPTLAISHPRLYEIFPHRPRPLFGVRTRDYIGWICSQLRNTAGWHLFQIPASWIRFFQTPADWDA